jgi:GT2 family glycosyltransferase
MADTVPQVALSICIISFRRPALLQRCLESISPGKQTLDSSMYEVVISDDCPESSAKPVVQASGFARWVQGPSQGVAANRNNVVHAATGRWIVFLDDDELPQIDWLEKIYQAASSDQWDVIEGRVEPVSYPDNIFWLAPAVFQGGVFCTANLAIRRSTFYEIGGFDIRNRVSHEDIELGARIVAFGLRTVYLPDAIVYHPARRLTCAQLLLRLFQQHYHTYSYQHLSVGNNSASISHLFSWSARYILACQRLEWMFKPHDHQFRPFLLTILRLAISPIVIARIILPSRFLFSSTSYK